MFPAVFKRFSRTHIDLFNSGLYQDYEWGLVSEVLASLAQLSSGYCKT